MRVEVDWRRVNEPMSSDFGGDTRDVYLVVMKKHTEYGWQNTSLRKQQWGAKKIMRLLLLEL